MLNLYEGHTATRRALWVHGKPFCYRTKRKDKSISQPPWEGQTCHSWMDGGQINMAVQWEMLGMIVRNVSAPSVTKSAVMAFRARWGFCLDSLFF